MASCHENDDHDQGRTTPTSNSSVLSPTSSLAQSPAIVKTVTFEPREKFTLYKIRINDGDRTWVVFRRYSDFVLLNGKLKKLFPNIVFNLPPKRYFRDNFNLSFIRQRQAGLESFMHNIFCLPQVGSSEPVQRFFRLDHPPEPNEDLETSQKYCQSLELSCHELKQECCEKDNEILRLRNELDHLVFFQDQNSKDRAETTTGLLLAKSAIEKQLEDTKREILRKEDEIRRLKSDQSAEEAFNKAARLNERQRREAVVKEQNSALCDAQRRADDLFQSISYSLQSLGKVRIDAGGRTIEVEAVDGLPSKEKELRKALVDSRREFEVLYREHLDLYRKELEDVQVDLESCERRLQTANMELHAIRSAIAEVHARHEREIAMRDACVQQCQLEISTRNQYINSLEQKYFYALLLGVKLNMALYGRDGDFSNNRLQPSSLFIELRDLGITVEHWPSWVSKKLATVIS